MWSVSGDACLKSLPCWTTPGAAMGVGRGHRLCLGGLGLRDNALGVGEETPTSWSNHIWQILLSTHF